MLAKCPHCGHPNEVQPRSESYTLQCPGCHRALRVPARKTPQAAPRAAAAVGAAPELAKAAPGDGTEADRAQAIHQQEQRPADTGGEPDDFPTVVTEDSAKRVSHRPSRRRRKKSQLPTILAVGSVFALVIIASLGWWLVQQRTTGAADPEEDSVSEVVSPRYRLLRVRSRRVFAGNRVEIPLVVLPKPGDARLRYEQVSGPAGAEVDGTKGLWVWNVPADMASTTEKVEVAVQWGESPSERSVTRFLVTVVGRRRTAGVKTERTASPADGAWSEVSKRLASRKLQVRLLADPPQELRSWLGGELRRVSLEGEEVWAVWFEKSTDLERKLEGFEFGEISMPESAFPENWAGKVQLFRSGNWLWVYAGLNEATLDGLKAAFGRPLAYRAAENSGGGLTGLPGMRGKESGRSEEKKEEGAGEAQVEDERSSEWKAVIELYENKQKLFRLEAYKALRAYLASQFAEAHAAEINAAWGGEDEASRAFRAFLEEHPDIREELLIAIDPDHDRVEEALGLFRRLYEGFPDRFADYASLAIATAVTWDQPNVTWSYRGLRRHAGALEGGPPADGIASFGFYVEAEPVMQGRVRFLPWEMLVHVVNHETPLVERQWALQNYLPKRVGIGKCYHDVPYDHGYYRIGPDVARLKGKPYTLPAIRQFGGICGNQADFASRVARTLGVPAASVSGVGRYGEGHAWVMWVELRRVTPTGIQFSLESYGRYRGDMYYVGHLKNPQTGRSMTDRQLEVYLHSVGISPRGRRQAAMLMRIYPRLRDELSLNVDARLEYLAKVLDLSPFYDAAWRELAAMVGEEEVQASKKHRQRMRAVIDTLFRTFAPFPDFTWEVFADLVAIEDDAEKQNALYTKLIQMYEQAKRPDLAFQARMVLAKRLEEQDNAMSAANLLADGIQRHPDEGRFVPKVLDELERLCQTIENGDQVLIPFLASFLPKIPQKRGRDPSKYCMQMYERAIARFQEAGRADLAARYQAELTKLKAAQAQQKLRSAN